MSMKLISNYKCNSVAYTGNFKNSFYRLEDRKERFGSKLFEQQLANPQSSIGRSCTDKELIDDVVRANEYKKQTLYEMMRDAHPEGIKARFSFAGESKIYSFHEFIEEFERRSKQNL